MLRHALEAHGHAVLEARDEPEAIRELRQTRPVVVLTDLKLPVGDGFGVLRAAKELDPDLPVVVMTAYGSIQDAVSAMREGAMDFLAKPVEPDHLLLMVARAIAQRRILTEYIVLKEELAERRASSAKTASCVRYHSSSIARPRRMRPSSSRVKAELGKNSSPERCTH